VGVNLERRVEIKFSGECESTSHGLERYTLGAQLLLAPLRIKKNETAKEIELTFSPKLSVSNSPCC
jgi:hypothetical protein